MDYVDSILEPGETLHYRTSVSGTIYIPSILFTLCSLAVLIAGVNNRESIEIS